MPFEARGEASNGSAGDAADCQCRGPNRGCTSAHVSRQPRILPKCAGSAGLFGDYVPRSCRDPTVFPAFADPLSVGRIKPGAVSHQIMGNMHFLLGQRAGFWSPGAFDASGRELKGLPGRLRSA